MAVKRIAAETLIELAVETLRTEIAADLPAQARYTVAMIVNALEIARREILSDGEAAQYALLDQIYDDGEGSPKILAADIRAGRVNDAAVPDLRAKLREIVVGELKIKNPRFLEARR